MPRSALEQELSGLLNKHSAENASDTPDFILARLLIGYLDAWNEAVCARRKWHGDAETTDAWKERETKGEG